MTKTTATLIALAAVLAACGSAPASAENTAQATGPRAMPVSPAEEAEVRNAERTQATFPVDYRGNWDFGGSEGCDRAESGTRFAVTTNQIKGYEDTSTLSAIEVLDEHSIRVVLDNQSSDGDRTLVQTFRLSPVAGITLRIETDGRQSLATRCDPV